MKKLTMKCSAEGKHQIFDGDEQVGEMADDHLKNYAKNHLGMCEMADTAPGDGEGGDNPTNKMAELFAELGLGLALKARPEGTRDSGLGPNHRAELKRLVEAGRAATVRERQGEARRLLLAECFRAANEAGLALKARPEGASPPGPGQAGPTGAVTLNEERAIQLMREGKITGIDYAEANQAEKLLDRAVRELKILPRDRGFYLRDAIERPAEFAEFIRQAVPVIRLGSLGTGSGEQVPVDEEVDRGVRKLMSDHEAARKPGEPKLSYGTAMKQFFRENPGLEERYRAAHRRQPRDGSEPQGMVQ